ncbi:MAG: dTDP-4-amino-4,6-dideoxygalactose transaminase [Proteobacteria bacterium]|nr:dTDP-4-amino-4,6-dideoxygalactose transaminase [Pseudomonadota bacterium]
MSYKIPFCRVSLEGTELDNLAASLRSGYIAGDGQFTKKCQNEIERLIDARSVLLTTSCTSALELSALLLDIGPGDEVILPSFTFVSTANAFVLRGARPVFVDIRPDTLNLDEGLVAQAITPKTRAIVPVHYAGVGCDMDALGRLADMHDLRVVEDAAQGFLATYRGRQLGAIGDIGCFSFHETKTFTCGEGGAVVLNRPDLVRRAEILREKGTNRSAFFRGEVDKYTWIDVGSSYLPSDLLAAVLLAQIDCREGIIDKRRAIFERYAMGLSPLADRGRVALCRVPEDCTVNYHMFYFLAADRDERTALLAHMRKQGILATFHYVPLHTSPFARRYGSVPSLPVTESVADRLVRLPLYNSLTEDEQEQVIRQVVSFYDSYVPAT